MRSTGSTTLTLPPFAGSTRKLVLANLAVFFVLGLLHLIQPNFYWQVVSILALQPAAVFHGFVWQVFTYAFVNTDLLNTAFALLTLWFTATTLEEARGSRWLIRLYYGTAIAGGALAVLLTLLARLVPGFAPALQASFYFGMFAPLFSVLIAFAMLFGEVEFLFFFVLRIKAKYLVAIMVLWRLGLLFWSKDVFSATVELCTGLLAYLYVRHAQAGHSNRAAGSTVSERYYALRNDYYRWKRKRAAKDFQVYMHKQNRDVHFDNEGRYISPEDERRDPSDKRWMN